MTKDIKTTIPFIRMLAQTARMHHNGSTSIKVSKEVWIHYNDTTSIKHEIWCSFCGTFFSSLEEFNEKHGGV